MATKIYKRIELGTYDIPTDAVTLIEDIVRLEQVARLLDQIDPLNCSVDRMVGIDSHAMMRSMAYLCHKAAKAKFKQTFLSR